MIFSVNTYKYIFYILFIIVLSILLYTANHMSISYDEALNVFKNSSLLTLITNSSIKIFGQNDIALRLPFIVFYGLSIILMFNLTKDFFKKEIDKYVSIIIFMFLPGMLSAALLVNSAIVVIFFTLLYVTLYKKEKQHSYFLLLFFLFLDNSFAIFYLALILFGVRYKEKKLILISLILFFSSLIIYGFDSGGKPAGFLVDTFAIYSTIFSPLLFLYFFYYIYRSGIKNERGLIWYISVTSLGFSLLLSFRQRIYIEDFAPFVVIFVPYMVKGFFHTIRVRLPQFRRKHYYITVITLFIFIISVFFTIINKPIYLILKEPEKHFIYKYDIAKQLSEKLKENKINEIRSDNNKLLLRLRFYDLKEGNNYFLTSKKIDKYDYIFPIEYYGKIIKTFYVVKQ